MSRIVYNSHLPGCTQILVDASRSFVACDTTMMTKDTKVDDGKLSVGGVPMATCEVCGNENDNSIQVHIKRQQHTFDTLESAIQGGSPTCSHCSCRLIGHGIEVEDRMFCCAHCAAEAGESNAVKD